MSVARSDDPRLLEAFIKSVQYIVGLESQQDVRDHLCQLITTHLTADWVAFAQREADGRTVVDHSTLNVPASQDLLTPQVRGIVADVLDSGFLACEVTRPAAPSMTAFLPIVEESHPRAVMLVGHGGVDPISKDLLNVYLAIAGLAGTTLERLRAEIELSGYRAHLEELVVDRTSRLQSANEDLTAEMAQREAAEQALHAERERLSITLRSIGDGVIATDTESRVVLLNGAAEEMTGWSLAEATGRPIAEVFGIVDERTELPAEIPVERVLETGATVDLAGHTVLIARDGRKFSVADSCAPIKSQGGTVTGAVLVFRDVTEQRRAEALREALSQINAAASASLDVDAIARGVVDKAADALGCERVFIAFNRDGLWDVSHASKEARPLIGECFRFDQNVSLGPNPCTDPLVLNGRGLQSMLSQRLIDALHAESIAFMPIVVRGETAAALAFVNLSNSSPPVRSQLDFIGNLAASMSLALDNASLYEAERLAATSARTLAAINEILLSAVTPGDVLRRLVGEASAAAGADKCLVIAVDKERYTIAHVRNMNDDLVGQRHDALFFPTFARAAQERRPILIDDTEADSRTNKDFVRSHGLGALQLLPISIDDEVVAVLALAYDAPRAFGSEDMRFSERLAAAMSLAMRSARLYESEHRIAETLQEALLSLPERLAGIEYAHAYRSATESTRVGGDFYDVFEISPGRIGIVVGDISGKGLQAAVLTSRVKHSILAYAFDGDRGPAEILSLTNMAFYKTTAPEQFATVFFGILDVRQGCLIYSNAGHTTGAVTRVDGATTRLSSTGPVLGAIEQPAFGEESVHLDSDKLLLLYTDGITEARNGSELYGEDRLFRLLTEAKSADPTDLVGRIMLAVQQFSGGSRRDDIAVLAVRRLPD